MSAVFLALLLCVAIFLLYGQLVSLTFQTTVSGEEMNTTTTLTGSGENVVKANPTLAVAQPSTLTVRTNGTSGSLTMTSGSHGILTGDRVDLYWDGGKCYGATVGTVAGSVVPITAVAGGDALPNAATAINVGIINEAVFNVVGNNMQAIAIQSVSTGGYCILADGAGDHHPAYVAPGAGYSWVTGSGVTNPIAGDTLTKVRMSQRGTTSVVTDMKAAAIVA